MYLFLFVAGLFNSETITVRTGGSMRDKGDSVSGHNPMIQGIDGIIAENSFDYIDWKFKLLGDCQCSFSFLRKL